jgi:aspartate carbamoyltransferase catalytic subunit
VNKPKHIIDINDFSKKDILEIFELAIEAEKYPDKTKDYLNNKNISVLFFEPSTRTKESFKSAIFKMNGKVLGFDSKLFPSIRLYIDDIIRTQHQ